jgi:polar amino acid transport system substrate-binding protein
MRTTRSTGLGHRSSNYGESVKTLRVGAAFPDPPFNGVGDGGLDIDLINAIAGVMGVSVQLVAYDGPDFDGIFAELGSGRYDCVVSGTTVTPDRERMAVFAPPYLVSGQSLAVDTERFPTVRSVDDLAGLTIGVQQGNTSQPIAERLVAHGKVKAVRVYRYGDIRAALTDLTTGGCDAFMKLGPVLTELVGPVAGVEVVQRNLSRENIAIAVAAGAEALQQRMATAQAELEDDGTLQGLRRKWLGNPYVDQSLAAH